MISSKEELKEYIEQDDIAISVNTVMIHLIYEEGTT